MSLSESLFVEWIDNLDGIKQEKLAGGMVPSFHQGGMGWHPTFEPQPDGQANVGISCSSNPMSFSVKYHCSCTTYWCHPTEVLSEDLVQKPLASPCLTAVAAQKPDVAAGLQQFMLTLQLAANGNQLVGSLASCQISTHSAALPCSAYPALNW